MSTARCASDSALEISKVPRNEVHREGQTWFPKPSLPSEDRYMENPTVSMDELHFATH